MSDKRLKLVMISDHPLAPSGVGMQARYILEQLERSGKFDIIFLAAAIKHPDYRPQKIQEWPNTMIIPVDGYGNSDIMRQILDFEAPDLIWIITDPRYYEYLFQMEDEIHQFCPIVWWAIWDNYDKPFERPRYNDHFYKATDYLVAISKCTHKMLIDGGFGDKTEYLPHGVPEEDFKILPEEDILKMKKMTTGADDSFVVFYNSRNALRKRTGNVLLAFKLFLDELPKEEKEKCFMLFKCSPFDPEGMNMHKAIEALELDGRVAFNDKQVANSQMCEMYNIADVTCSASSEEGFGLSVLESLQCGTPVICTKTGGMQDQVIDSETGEEFGFCLEPESYSFVGSQTTPYIVSHHLKPESMAKKIRVIYDEFKITGKHKEKWAGERSRASVLRRFNLKKVQQRWEDIILEQIEKFKKEKKLKGEKSQISILTL